jgi:hypothetical protein
MAGKAKEAAFNFVPYKITEEDAAALNYAVSVDDVYPFLAVTDDGENATGHLFLPHKVVQHSHVSAKAATKDDESEDSS